jgi:hypothetical protein
VGRGASADADRAGGPSDLSPQAVSAVPALIAGAARRFILWVGPFGVAIAAIFLLLVGAAVGEKPSIAICVLGGLMLLSALEMYAERARADERSKWATLIADMIAKKGSTTFKVTHTFESLRPQLDEIVEDLVARGMSARQGENSRSEVEGEARQPGPEGTRP